MIVDSLKPLAVPLNRVRLDPENARLHNERNLDAIRKSLQRFGQRKPIVADIETGIVEAGNGTLIVATELGWTEIAVVWVKDDKATAKAYAIADNRSGELAEWADDVLAESLVWLSQQEEPNIDDFDVPLIDATGFSVSEVDAYIRSDAHSDKDADAIPENIETRCKPGDLWILGSHRLVCGDSTNVQHVALLMGGETATVVFTDPPYGIAFKAMRKQYEAIANDETAIRAHAVIRDALRLHPNLKAAFVCCDWRSISTVIDGMAEANLPPKACIVWDKMRGVQNLDRYYKQHEMIVYSGPYGGEKTQCGDVWQFARDFDPDHPTPKPVALIERALVTCGYSGDKVVDMFLGSGSTLIACEKLSRRGFGIEMDPHYCDVVIARWEAFTGQVARLAIP